MKKIILYCCFYVFAATSCAQKQTFDITTYTMPAGWKKQTTGNTIQITKEDAANGTYCMISLFKALPGTEDSKENFDAAWETVVKNMVKVSAAPEMQQPATENGWEVQSGYASFENDGDKGMVVLVPSTASAKMVNIIILTNTNEYEKDVTAFLESISFKKTAANKTVVDNKPVSKPADNVTNNNQTGFAFNTTNFDDGWTSVVKEDWVEVSKGTTSVLIHYPNKQADAYNSVVLEGLKNAWNVLVAPKYNTASNFEFKPITGWQSIEFAEADAVEKESGKAVHVVLFKMNYSNGSGKYLEFITPDKQSFENEFGPYHQTTSGWEKMESLANYNKFAVAATDLAGKWTTDFSGAIQYVNAYTGFDAGMDTHASAENYQFSSGNTYKWDLAVASGPVGNIKFQSVKSNGRFTMNGNWQVNFSDIEGKPRNYNIYFSCIKGLRILWIDNKPYAKAE